MQAAKPSAGGRSQHSRTADQECEPKSGSVGSDSFLAALVAAGYGGISVDEIIDLRNHGVSADFLRAISQSWSRQALHQN
jgi:hypothetical protein